ncbi:MAG: polysaccharide biosynthesis protein [Oscillospiraceae bacterium]|nr:polysaccharide biosynthesis protein [Oscillospiraceae bacterium]
MAKTVKRQSFIHGAAILAVSVGISKALGAVYKIPLGNILGDEGFAHFNVAYSIYSLLLTLSNAGLPTALSRLIAKADATGHRDRVYRTFWISRWTFIILGALGTAVMLFFAGNLAETMGDSDAAASIIALAPAIVLVCTLSAYRGYAQGLGDMRPTAVSTVIETGGKLVFGLALAYFMLAKFGTLPLASSGAILGVTIGAIATLFYLLLRVRPEKVPATPQTESRKHTLKILLTISIPITLGASVLSIIGLTDTFFIINRLKDAAGFTQTEASIAFGVFSKAQTLFNVPQSFIVPLTISVIPAISARAAQNNHSGVRSVTETALKLVLLLALPASIGLSVLAEPIMGVVYAGSAGVGAELLQIQGIAAFFVCLALVTNSVLQAYGKERYPVYTMIAGGVIKIAMTYFLVGIPEIGIRGAAWSTLACYAVISLSNFVLMKRVMKIKLPPAFLRCVISSAAMGASAYFGYYALLRLNLPVIASLGGAIIAAVIVYALLIIVLKAISKDDLSYVPKGDKIAQLLRVK